MDQLACRYTPEEIRVMPALFDHDKKHNDVSQDIFEKMDWDKSGTISCVEFKAYLAKLKRGEELDHEEVVKAFNKIDVDGSKQINWEEFFVSF